MFIGGVFVIRESVVRIFLVLGKDFVICKYDLEMNWIICIIKMDKKCFIWNGCSVFLFIRYMSYSWF